MDGIEQPITDDEVERIKWLTEQNVKHLGERYRRAAEEMAITQVFMERCEHFSTGENEP